MIGRIRGIVIEKQAPEVLIEAAGVGYEIQMPMTNFYQLPDVDQEAVIYTHFVVREDAQLLYGFINKTERHLFRLLIKANGVGPKLGLAILSGMSAEQFVQCVQHDDSTALVKLPGIGKKTAERLIIEMRDRIKDWGVDISADTSNKISGTMQIESTFVIKDDPSDDAMSALVSLGYTQSQAQKAVKAVYKESMNSEETIKLALKSML
ncbi:Holliday junction branch migration protein RuvA [Flocculibacter collagenilyticus]|uniref:Holliday junction branch migration protein RuvA n=1 Tax=Flocculibacter collagenilyticus TaxID=2744479 RepID=UPI0018F74661|nr:Holliday junction branch migration protein RuvA [Flocculibacter collagenilyticus]